MGTTIGCNQFRCEFRRIAWALFALAAVGSCSCSERDEVILDVPTADCPSAPPWPIDDPLAETCPDVGDPSTVSSIELVSSAEESGLLDAETALLYRVFAIFGDERLPEEFRSGAMPDVTHVLAELPARWESLSMATRSALEPFLLRPNEDGSWANGGTIAKASPFSRCITWPSRGWSSEDGKHVRVWRKAFGPNAPNARQAREFRDEIESTIWPRLFGARGLGLRVPMSDVGIPRCDVGDPRLDVFLVDMESWGEHATLGGSTSPDIPCKESPVAVMVNEDLPWKLAKTVITHELVHASQYAYAAQKCVQSYGWLPEATAMWAVDYVYPSLQTEHPYAECYTATPQKPLDDRAGCSQSQGRDRAYGAYLFFQFMAKTSQPRSVAQALANMEKYSSSLDAVDAALPGGFEENWWKFSTTLYNRPPVMNRPDSFFRQDQLSFQPTLNLDVFADVGGEAEVKTVLTNRINNLSTKYYRFSFLEQRTRSLLYYNGFSEEYRRGVPIRVRALWTDADAEWHEEDWSNYDYVGFCRDLRSQRVGALIVIISNGDWQPAGGGALDVPQLSFLKASNLGCWRYAGTAKHVYHYESTDWTVESALRFEGDQRTTALDFQHPAFPHTLRLGAGLGFLLPPVGDSAVFTYRQGGGLCTSTVGPVTLPITTPGGFLFLNTFPELKATEPSIASLLAFPSRSYSAAVTSYQLLTETLTGDTGDCGRDEPRQIALPPLLFTNDGDAAAGVLINPPIADRQGNLLGSFEPFDDYTYSWSLFPEAEP